MTDKAIELVSIFASGGALLLGILLTFRKLDDSEEALLADAIINEAEADAMVELHERGTLPLKDWLVEVGVESAPEAQHPMDGVPYCK